MARWFDGIENAVFKPVDGGGFIFMSAHPWLFGSPRYYLVNDAQKAAIAAVLRKHIEFKLIMTALTLLVVLPGFVVLALSGVLPKMPSFVLGILLGALMLPLLVVVPQLYLWRALGPIIKELPPTDQRFSLRERYTMPAYATPKWLLYATVVGGVLMVTGGGIGIFEAIREGQSASRWLGPAITMTMGIVFIGYFTYLLRVRRSMPPVA